MDGLEPNLLATLTDWLHIGTDFAVWQVQVIKSFMPKCGRIGGPDFVATSIALNLAVEFWGPLKGFTGHFLSEAGNRADSLLKSVKISKLDSELKSAMEGRLKTCISEVRDETDYIHEINRISRWFFVISASIGFVVLFLGITSPFCVCLMLPLIIYVMWSFLHYRKLIAMVEDAEMRLKDALYHHVFDGAQFPVYSLDEVSDNQAPED